MMGVFGSRSKSTSSSSPSISPSASLDSGYTSSHDVTSASSPPRKSPFFYTRRTDITLSAPLPTIATLPSPPSLDRLPKPPKEVIDPLMRGIWYHENEHLDAAAYYFSVSANAGSQLGLFLYAIHLRHGWGVTKDETAAVNILVATADNAVTEVVDTCRPPANCNPSPTPLPPRTSSKIPIVDRADTPSTLSTSPRTRRIATEELSFALYELSNCFRQGWGVRRNRDTGMYYLKVAAQLGDMSAQLDLAECYLRGDGVKKDKGKAARLYREALEQGAEVPGMHWVYKEKYDA
ncbi:hypothetical protein HDU96_007100 [Phlyctochytrium bullatum]|nr:hypothetical protein HDU96_007100 [Phlyctochytrium bullatum]